MAIIERVGRESIVESLYIADTQNTRQVTVIRSIPTEMLLPIYTKRADETQPSTVQLWTVHELSNDSETTVQLCSSPADLSRPQLSPHSRGCVRGSEDPS